MHGYGVENFENGDHYEGNYRNCAKNGKGTFVYINGKVYSGHWVNDKLTEGTLLEPEKMSKYVG